MWQGFQNVELQICIEVFTDTQRWSPQKPKNHTGGIEIGSGEYIYVCLGQKDLISLMFGMILMYK